MGMILFCTLYAESLNRECGQKGKGRREGGRGEGAREETLSLLAKIFKVVEKTLKELQWE